MACLTADEIAAYAGGGASSLDARAIDTHADSCESCRQAIAAAVRAGRTEHARRVGRYIVIDELGAGGMGIVYRALDPELGRRVAVKLLHRERVGDSDAARARLAREARTLAALSHPNVVTVHDLGNEGEEVFVAMELVPGTTLRQWLADAPRDVRAILDVFRQAGRGLAAAHAIGIVHRDFKPENVLVREDGRVQVGDFGLARVEGGDDVTIDGALAGTLPYMAPEQLRGDEVDTRSDQFSFGVALYEALCGERPFAGATVAERRASIERGEVSAARMPAWLRPIVRRALAADPRARFPSMDALVTALGRDPARRRRRVGAAVALVAAASTATAVIVMRTHAAPSCASAQPRLAHVWDAERKRAIHDAFLATKRPFAADVWTATERALDRYAQDWVAAEADACEATRVHGTQSEALLDLRSECLDERLAAIGALVDVLAHADNAVVENAGRAVAQLPQLAACADKAALQATVPPPADPATARRVAELRTQLARASALRSAGKPTDALAIATPVAAAAQSLGYAPLTAEALLARGVFEGDTDHGDASAQSLAAAADAAEAGRADATKAEAWAQLVRTDAQRAHYPDAHAHAQHAIAVLARLGPGHEATAARVANFEGGAYMAEGNYGKALELQQRALALREKLYAGDSAEIATSLNSLGNVLYNLSRYPEAKQTHERALAMRRRLFGSHHPDVAASDNNLSSVYASTGAWDDALARLTEAKQICDEVFGPTSSRSAQVIGNIANLYKDAGRFAEAVKTGSEALALQEKALGPDHPMVATLHYLVGKSYLELGDFAHAEPELTRALELRRTKLGPDHPEVLTNEEALARLTLQKGDPRAAKPALERVIAAMERTMGAEAADLPEALGLLATADRELGDHAGELANMQRSLAIDEKNVGHEHGDTAMDLIGIGVAKLALGNAKAALPELEEAKRLVDKLGDIQPGVKGDAYFALAQALWQAGGDRGRALGLAHAARDIFASQGSAKANELRDAGRWLTAHDRSR